VVTDGVVGADPSLASAPVPGQQPDVSVVLPASGAAEDLASTLAGLRLATDITLEVVVVHAGGHEPARAEEQVRLVRAPVESSEAALRTLGLLASRGRFVTFLAPGDQVGPGALSRLARRLAESREQDAVVLGSFGGSAVDRVDILAGAGLVLAAREHARTGRFEERLGRRALLGYWLDVVAHHDLATDVVTVRGERAHPSPDRRWPDELADHLALLAHLEESSGGLERSRPTRRLLHEARSWVGRSINAVVLASPERHADVVAAVRERALDDVPWTEINHGLARDLAILQLFPPLLDTSALVAARRLRGWGRMTDVVSMDPTGQRADPAATGIAGEYVDEHVTVPRRALPVWPSVLAFTEDVLAAVAELEERKGPHESLYSRAMFVHSHFAAAALKLRRPSLHWVAEFSDPISQNPYGEQRLLDVGEDWLGQELGTVLTRLGYDVTEQRRLFEWCELLPYALADEILYTNEQQREVMLGYCPVPELAERARRLSRVEHHPTPVPELYQRVRSTYSLDPDKVNIGYFGNFYITRGLGEVVAALDGLDLAQRDRLRLHIFTANPEPVVARMIERGVSDVVRVVPMRGYLEYLNATTRFDVLLLSDYETKPQYDLNPYLPAKLADYLGSGTRIWGVHEPGSILSQTEVAYRSELGDAAGAASVLRRVLADAG
jgi:hypothetical protein